MPFDRENVCAIVINIEALTKRKSAFLSKHDVSWLYVTFQDELTNALATMRVDYDTPQIKPLTGIKNALMDKRGKKKGKGDSAAVRS